MNSRGNRRTIPKAAKLEALAVKLETSISIAWQRKTRRRALHGALAATSATVVLVFAHLAALDGSYLDWNLAIWKRQSPPPPSMRSRKNSSGRHPPYLWAQQQGYS